jgi:hypothetical protein
VRLKHSSLSGFPHHLHTYLSAADDIIIIIIVTQGWVVNGVRRHAEPLGDNDPPQLCQRDAEDGYRNTFRVLGTRSADDRHHGYLTKIRQSWGP